jgi:hypothetical protein
MYRCIGYFLIAACIWWPSSGLAQNQPTPSPDEAERNAFQTPTTSRSKQGEPEYSRDKNPLPGSQGPASNPEGKNITEPTAARRRQGHNITYRSRATFRFP